METSPRRRERVFGTLAGKLVGILVTFLVAALAVIGFTLLQSWTLEGGAAAINDIGSERMRTYRIVYLLSEYARGPRDEATAREVRATVLAFETALTGVRRGDPARPLVLPRGREIAERMDAVEQSWQQSIRPAIQAALAGQGVALARVALVHETLQRGELVEPFGSTARVASPFGYWLVRWQGRAPSAHLQAFEDWVLQQAAQTRAAIESQR